MCSGTHGKEPNIVPVRKADVVGRAVPGLGTKAVPLETGCSRWLSSLGAVF